MSNLIPLDEAAKMLSISPERLVEMISKKQIFGYRDGSSWKFKSQEIERVSDEFGLGLAGGAAADDSGSFSLSDSSLNDDLILDDSSSDDEDFELSDDLDSLSSLAKSDSGGSNDDSNFDLSDSSELFLSDSSSDLVLSDDSSDSGSKSKAGVGEEDDLLLFGDSSLDLVSGDSKKSLKGDSDVHDSDLLLSDDAAGSTGKLLKAMSDRVGDSKDEISLSEDELFDDDLRLADSDSLDDAVDLSSDYEDSDIVLDDSDSSSELVLESNELGISLGANDSGIELSGGLELAGSDIDDLELPDDDMISLSEAADADAATLMQEDDFNLTPFEESDTDDSSGSQVIALEDSDLFSSDSDSTLLNDADMVAQPQMLSDSPLQPEPVVAGGVAATPEIPFTVWQNVALVLVASLLLISLPIVFDTARNLWMPSDQVTHSGILNMILELTGMK
ncbi:MAG: helix-turn-helix domain-containing protein [Pirellulaceae bacterium]|nr:helix-turn-helix domain-containing protein [Pirellulaceae bacterium]